MIKNISEIVNFLKKRNYIIDKNYTKDLQVLDITYDSRDVKKGSLFFCKGLNFSEKYLISAKEKGAIIYISEKKYDIDIPYIIVRDIRLTMLELARYYFDYPDTKIKTIGVTGTKGKSTTVMLVKSILDKYLNLGLKSKVGIISSVLTYDGKKEFESHLSTPEAVELYRSLDNAVNSGLEYMVIEVSSQALKFNRVNNISFDVVGLLNIGSDHIGTFEHPNLDDYINSKIKLFELSSNVIYSKDSDNIEKIEKATKYKNVTTYTMDDKKADYKVENIISEKGINTFKLLGYKFIINALGKYNIENAMCAILICKYFGVDLLTSSKILEDINIDDRSELLESKNGEIVSYVNYAHNELSFVKNYDMIKQLFPNYKIISVFGASGGKGLNRRKELSVIADKYSEIIYFVPDDPNYDNTVDISKEMSKYLTGTKFEIFESREEAIVKCFNKKLFDKTLFFIAGKAEECYQLVKGDYIEITSDIDVARREMKKYNENNKK